MPDGYCYECGDAFHFDDCGGYNPPCPCGCGRCRSCCAADATAEDDYAYDESGTVRETPR